MLTAEEKGKGSQTGRLQKNLFHRSLKGEIVELLECLNRSKEEGM